MQDSAPMLATKLKDVMMAKVAGQCPRCGRKNLNRPACVRIPWLARKVYAVTQCLYCWQAYTSPGVQLPTTRPRRSRSKNAPSSPAEDS